MQYKLYRFKLVHNSAYWVGYQPTTSVIRSAIRSAAASGGRFVPVPGGVLILDASNDVVGAVGISGDSSDRDEYCAIEGIRAAGYVSSPDEPSADWKGSGL